MSYKLKLLTIVLITLFACGEVKKSYLADQRQKEIRDSLKTDSLQREILELEILRDPLLSNFYVTDDDFSDFTYYRHKYWDLPNFILYRTTLMTELSVFVHSGITVVSINLISNFCEQDWIFHNGVTVRVNGENLRSEIVESYDRNNRTRVLENGIVYENITYFDSDSIIYKISENYKQPIKVRFHGKEYAHDIDLREGDQIAIKESMDLYKILKEIEGLKASL